MLQRFPLYAYIPANDIARARRFYEDKLGFQPKKEIAGGVAYEFGDGRHASSTRHRTPARRRRARRSGRSMTSSVKSLS